MKLTNHELVNLSNHMTALKSRRMPMSILRCVIKNARTLAENYNIYQEQLQDIFNRCARRDETGNYLLSKNGLPSPLPDKEAQYAEELSELLNLEISLHFETFSAALLEKWDESKYDALTADELEILYKMTDSGKET